MYSHYAWEPVAHDGPRRRVAGLSPISEELLLSGTVDVGGLSREQLVLELALRGHGVEGTKAALRASLLEVLHGRMREGQAAATSTVGAARKGADAEPHGSTYGCGWNAGGDGAFSEQFVAVPELRGRAVTRLACSEDAAVAVTEAGDVYVWGWQSGVTAPVGSGRANTAQVPARAGYAARPFVRPALVRALSGESAAAVAAGQGAAAVVSRGGDVWA
jgi:hypothetical protein